MSRRRDGGGRVTRPEDIYEPEGPSFRSRHSPMVRWGIIIGVGAMTLSVLASAITALLG